MDLQGLRGELAPHLSKDIDLDQAWQRYRAGGGFDDRDEFVEWLLLQYPALPILDNARDGDVQLSQVMPARLAAALERTAIDLHQTRPPPRREASAGEAPASPVGADFHYVVLGDAGSGGMGTVHVVRDTELLRKVALKTVNPATIATPGGQARFLREVQITAQLSHPNIVAVYALEVTPEGSPAYTMKLVEGRTFQAMLAHTREFHQQDKSPDEAHALPARLEHFLKVCDAIAYAHDKGVIHRDLKPANLMLGRHNEVYVMDWGLCRLVNQHTEEIPADASRVGFSAEVSGNASETQVGDVVGTPKYMSPEQAQGRNQELDARSDQCALGLILFELVTLGAAYAGKNAYEVMVNAAMGRRQPVQPAFRSIRVPRELKAVIERATAASPAERYADVAQFAADIRRYLRGEAVIAQPDNTWQQLQRWISRHRQTAQTVVLAGFAAGASLIGWLLWKNQHQALQSLQREQHLVALHDVATRIGDRVQGRFLQLEGAINNLGDSIVQFDEFGQGSDERYYLGSQFQDPGTAPADLIPSTIHSGKISLQWPVWSVPSGADQASAEKRIRRLTPLQPFCRDIYRRAAAMIHDEHGNFYSEDIRAGRGGKNPLMAIVVGLETGLAMRYPGWNEVPADFDPRLRPWYRLVADKSQPRWGEPYLSSVSGLYELPLSAPLRDRDDRFVGVVSALLLPAHLLPEARVRALLQANKVSGVRGIYLLDEDGHIMAQSGVRLSAAQTGPDQGTEQRFPDADVIAAVQARHGGVIQAGFAGVDSVIAYDVIEPLGWAVAVVAEEAALFAEPTAPMSPTLAWSDAVR